MPRGFLGTRADILMDLVLLAVVATPFLFAFSFRLVRSRRHLAHKRVQVTLLIGLLTAVLLFELDVRLSGGSGSLMRASSYAGTLGLRLLTIAHVAGAICTFLVWFGLTMASARKVPGQLPGRFSARHRAVGRWIFAGSIYTAISALAMYVTGFIL